MRFPCRPALLFLLAVSVPTLGSGEELAFTYRKIVDTKTTVPGSSELFSSVGPAPSIEGGMVAFSAIGESGTRGIYTMSGGRLETVADNVTTLPGLPGPLGSFFDPYVSDGAVAFATGFVAVYSNAPGPVTLIMDLNTPGISNGLHPWPQLDQGVVVDLEFGLAGGAGTIVASSGGAVEKIGPWGPFAIDAGVVAFADGPPISVRRKPLGGVASIVVSPATPVPGGGSFTGFYGVAIEDETTAFFATTTAGEGIYFHDGATVSVVADQNTPVPGFNGNFSGIQVDWFSLDEGVVAFATGTYGIYANFGGEIQRVVGSGSVIERQPATDTFLGPGAKSGNQIVFSAVLADGTRGIYVASVASDMPVLPGALAALVGALAALAIAALARVRVS